VRVDSGQPFVNSSAIASNIFLVTDNRFNPVLNPSEVIHLFSMPLSAFLHVHPSLIPGWHFGISDRLGPVPTYPLPPPIVEYASGEGEVGGREGRYYQYRDVPWGESMVRMHRFLTGREGGGVRPVYGLTAAILIHAAVIGYDQQPAFPIMAPGQKSMEERIKWEIRHGAGRLRRAIEAEGLWEEWKCAEPKL